MAKKEVSKLKKGFKKLYSDYKDKALDMVSEFLEEQVGNVVKWIKDVARIKKMMHKMIVGVILALAGALVLFLGVANTLAEYFTQMPAGVWQIIVGAVVIVIAKLYSH